MKKTCDRCGKSFQRADIKVFYPLIINDRLTPVLLCRPCFLIIDMGKEVRDQYEKELNKKGAQ